LIGRFSVDNSRQIADLQLQLLRPALPAGVVLSMPSDSLEAAEVCLALGHSSTASQRRTLLDLAGRWLKKAPDEPGRRELLNELEAMQRPPS
jgi:hypothetical protein